MLNRNLVIRAALALVAGLGIATTSWAGTATSNVAVSATVVTACTVAAAAVAFGTYDPTSGLIKAATAPLTVTCTKGATSVTIDLDAGTSTNRHMTDGTDLLPYQLYKATDQLAGTACASPPSAGLGIWGVSSGGTTLTPGTAFASSTTGLVFNICGEIPASQNVGVGSYTDTVVATATF